MLNGPIFYLKIGNTSLFNKIYFSQKPKNDPYIAIACVVEHEFLFK